MNTTTAPRSEGIKAYTSNDLLPHLIENHFEPGLFDVVAKYLLQANPSVLDTPILPSKSTLTHLAVAAGEDEIVELLVKHKANVRKRDCDGKTPLDRVDEKLKEQSIKPYQAMRKILMQAAAQEYSRAPENLTKASIGPYLAPFHPIQDLEYCLKCAMENLIELQTYCNRMNETSARAIDATIGLQDYAVLNAELQELKQAYCKVAANAKFAGFPLFSNEAITYFSATDQQLFYSLLDGTHFQNLDLNALYKACEEQGYVFSLANDLIFHHDKNALFCLARNQNDSVQNLLHYDLKTKKIVATLNTGTPYSRLIEDEIGRLWVSVAKENNLGIGQLNIDKLSVEFMIASHTLEEFCLSIKYPHFTLYQNDLYHVAEEGDTLCIKQINITDPTRTKIIFAFGNCYDFCAQKEHAFSPDGHFLAYVHPHDSKKVIIINTLSAYVESMHTNEVPQQLQWDKNHRLYWTETEKGITHVMQTSIALDSKHNPVIAPNVIVQKLTTDEKVQSNVKAGLPFAVLPVEDSQQQFFAPQMPILDLSLCKMGLSNCDLTFLESARNSLAVVRSASTDIHAACSKVAGLLNILQS